MATIKEVASYAQVSIGTVSNVINGKTDNPRLIEKVESAIKVLGYTPDAKARSLKNTKSNIIGVILPNMEHPKFQSLLSTIEKELRNNGYSIILRISENSTVVEEKSIEFLQQQKVDGIIVYTSMNNIEPYKRLLDQQMPIVFINEEFSTEQNDLDIVTVDYLPAFEKSLQKLKKLGYEKVGLIIENEISSTSIHNLFNQYFPHSKIIKTVDYHQESGFKAAYEILYNNPEVNAFITSNELLAKGTRKASSIIKSNANSKLGLITIKEENWIDDEDCYIGTITTSCKKIVGTIIEKILNSIDYPIIHEQTMSKLEANYFDTKELQLETGIPHTNKEISEFTMYLLESPAGHALEKLSKIYQEEKKVKINFAFFNYYDLQEHMYQLLQSHDSNVDGFMMDLTWIEDFVETNAIQHLDELIPNKLDYFKDFIDGLPREYGYYNNQLYGLPFMPGAQLLFFKKDIFENQQLQRQFRRMYNLELRPPETWAEFNLIAKFFTKRFNEKSPVNYGASMVKGDNIYTVINFLNRLWAYGSDIYDKGKFIINNQDALLALKNYTKSFQYTNTSKPINSGDHALEDFKTGETAMTVLYDSHAVELNDYTKSDVAGNIGYSLIPGKAPVLGGWSLAVNKHSKTKNHVLDFILWACSKNTAVPLSLLGGTTARESFYHRRELDSLYPWKSLVLESYKISKKRYIPEEISIKNKNDTIYNKIIGGELNKLLQGEQDEETTLLEMENKLNSLKVRGEKELNA